ncbi:MAG: aminotransferase class V-fold PLP-dependent enzyme, partial [Burkholderiales bacterium]|nr:aminotransferase class V-fold PLP-dependent enzyme [Burkholderiales bacterium]
MTSVSSLAHQHGALMIWDVAHSAGAVPLDLHNSGADMAVGCTYKYLNGGPGAPAFAWVHNTHLPSFQQPLTGWWGHTSPFQMSPDFLPARGIGRVLCGTQPIISMGLIECGLDIFARTDMQAIRSKSLALSDLFIQLIEQECAGLDLHLITPLEHAHRGSHLSYEHPHAYSVMQALIERKVIGDYRDPGVIRFGLTPL